MAKITEATAIISGKAGDMSRAVAETKSEPTKPPSQAPALQAAFIAAAERYRDAEHAMKHLTRLWQSSTPEERAALAGYPPDRS